MASRATLRDQPLSFLPMLVDDWVDVERGEPTAFNQEKGFDSPPLLIHNR